MTLKILILLIIAVFAVMFVIGNNILTVSYEKFRLDGITENIKVLQLSDLHKKQFGKGNKRLIKKIKELSPDIIIMSGDMVSRDSEDFDSYESLLDGIKDYRIFACFGNHETDMPAEMLERYLKISDRYGVKMLVNEFEGLGNGLNIAGLAVEREYYRNSDGSYRNLKEYTIADMKKALGEHSFPVVLLAHNPLFFGVYADWGAEIIFSGHVHGGVVRLPFVKGLLSPERKLFPKYSEGTYREKNSVMCVSRGLGKFRLFNPPEIVLAEIEPAHKG